VEPVSTLQFFPGDSLDDVQQFLGDQAFDFAEGLPLKNGAEIVSFAGGTFAEDQRSNLFKQRRWRIQYLFLEFFAALELGQFRKLTAREPQELSPFLGKYLSGSAPVALFVE
jgi:hypothetical protein